MSNALGTLFGDIAAAIREKNGETGTMKPAEFPDKISAIETGGGSTESSVQYKYLAFTATSQTIGQRITLDIGFKPDILYICNMSNVNKSGYGCGWFGISKTFADSVGVTAPNVDQNFNGSSVYCDVKNRAIDAAYDVNYPISAADETGFNIGDVPLYTGWVYRVYAIGGLA